jgi:hypothetical protein
MADVVNAPENKPEAGETSIHGGASLEETAPGQVSLPDQMSPANPKSPTETRDDKAEDAGDLGVNEPPEKKARKYMEEGMGHLMKRVREGFDLTSSALDKVQQHLDISRQNSKDLAQLAQDVLYDKVGAKYTLAQMQSMLNTFQNVEWQIGGTKADANTSLKAVANKTLAQATLANQNLKSIHTDPNCGRWIWYACSCLHCHGVALQRNSGIRLSTCTSDNTTSGTSNDSCVWDARLCIKLCHAAKCSYDASSGTDVSRTTSTSYVGEHAQCIYDRGAHG